MKFIWGMRTSFY